MLFKLLVFLTAAAVSVVADHRITVYNYCGQTKRAHVKNTGGFNYVSGLLGTNGGSYSVTVPERASSMIMFGENGECGGASNADGPGCTRLECDFSNPSYQQCNLSRVSGYSIPLAYSWTNGACTGGHCVSPNAGPNDCWVPNVDNGGSIRQCNTPGVGINLYLCGS